MQFEINSLTVNEFGNKENTPIVFIHGFPFDYEMWEYQVEALHGEYYCVVYDIRGLGKSYVGDGQYTMEAYVDDLFSVIDYLKLEKPVLCGLSMGGYIALRAAEKKQKDLGGLILCDTRAEADDDKGKVGRAQKINQINVEGLGKVVDDMFPNLFAEETIKEKADLYNSVKERSKSYSPLGVKGALFAMLSRTSTKTFLKKIKLPTLLLSGSFDKLTPPQLMREMHERIKDSEFGIVPRAGHLSPIENPDFVNDMIRGFLKRRIK